MDMSTDTNTEFRLSDLGRIGPRLDADGRLVFQDYDGTSKSWCTYPLQSAGDETRARTNKRRAVLRAMVTRRDNKRRVAAGRAALDATKAQS